jgi:hypothetical protein
MAKFGKCINFGMCSKADARESMNAGAEGDFTCPECGKMLVAASGKSGGGAASGGGGFPAKKAGIAGVGALALLGGAYLLIPPDETQAPGDPPAVVDPVTTTPPSVAPPAEPIITEPVTQQKDPPVTPPPLDPINVTPPPVDPPEVVQPQPVRRQAPPGVSRPKSDPQTPQATYSGPGSGSIVWEGEIDEREGLVTIDGNTADKGQVVSGGVPGGVPLVLSVKDSKNVGIAFTPQATSDFRRLVLRVKGRGKRRAVVDWSVAQ